MDILEQEAQVKASLAKLTGLLDEHEAIQRYKQLENKVQQNHYLSELVEQIKQAQKDAVQYAHYDKPEAERAAVAEADALTAEFDQHPLVVAYREQLIEVNDLLQHVTSLIQKEVNQALEEEGNHASEN